MIPIFIQIYNFILITQFTYCTYYLDLLKLTYTSLLIALCVNKCIYYNFLKEKDNSIL